MLVLVHQTDFSLLTLSFLTISKPFWEIIFCGLRCCTVKKTIYCLVWVILVFWFGCEMLMKLFGFWFVYVIGDWGKLLLGKWNWLIFECVCVCVCVSVCVCLGCILGGAEWCSRSTTPLSTSSVNNDSVRTWFHASWISLCVTCPSEVCLLSTESYSLKIIGHGSCLYWTPFERDSNEFKRTQSARKRLFELAALLATPAAHLATLE